MIDVNTGGTLCTMTRREQIEQPKKDVSSLAGEHASLLSISIQNDILRRFAQTANVYEVVAKRWELMPGSISPWKSHWMLAGELAAHTNTPKTTIRYYTLMKILPSHKGRNGYHYYSDETVNVLEYIASCLEVGLPLQIIKESLERQPYAEILASIGKTMESV